jgi:hypothetical protein
VSGAERLQQVREALLDTTPGVAHWNLLAEGHDALDSCVLLTAEEATRIHEAIVLASKGIITRNVADELWACIALLTPDSERGES